MDQIPLFEAEEVTWVDLNEPLCAELVSMMASIILAVSQTGAETGDE